MTPSFRQAFNAVLVTALLSVNVLATQQIIGNHQRDTLEDREGLFQYTQTLDQTYQ